MGQYYHCCFLNEKKNQPVKWFSPWKHDNGAKLMEHSYIGNNYCAAVENDLIDNPQYVVWAGDYADEEKRSKTNLYQRCTEKTEAQNTNQEKVSLDYFVINYMKKTYYKRGDVKPFYDGWIINPLPLLTSEGNGRGGGDYRGAEGQSLVGLWARDLIGLSLEEPGEDFVRATPFFSEKW